jgi:hypothetical protein
METFYNLGTLFENTTNEIKKDLLCNSIVFPRTDSLKEDKPLRTISYSNILDFDDIIKEVQEDTEFVAVNF